MYERWTDTTNGFGRRDVDNRSAFLPHLSVCDPLDAPHSAGGDVERADDNKEGGG